MWRIGHGLEYEPIWRGKMMGWRLSVQCLIACAALRTCSWRIEMRPLLHFESTGRPVGTAEFVTGLERVLGRRIARRAPGPAPAAAVSDKQLKLLQ